jgi:hypothetical protein
MLCTPTARRWSAAASRTASSDEGQLIIDQKDKTGTLFTDEPILILPYWVRAGNRKPRMVFGKELDLLVKKELRRLPRTKLFEVIGQDKKVLMRAKWMGREGITLQHVVRYPFVTGDLCGEDGKTVDLYVRNGKVVSKDGGVFTKGIITYTGVRIGN